MSESKLLREVQVVISKAGGRAFRNNTGTGWVGNVVGTQQDPESNHRMITLSNYRPLRAGLCVGSADLIGWTPVKITPAMVGKTLGVFTAIETKSRGKLLCPEQQQFLDQVNKSGGCGVCAYSVQEMLIALSNYVGRISE